MKTIFQSFRIFIVLTVLTGVVYPAVVTLFGQTLFYKQANGSLWYQDGKLRGSELLAQKFQKPEYFWPRPSAADYATVASGASNLGPTSTVLKENFEKRKADFQKANGQEASSVVPAEMLFASGSGLDPHVSPEGARIQISRIAAARKMDENTKEKLSSLVEDSIEPPQFGIFGKPRVNILRLNLALDSL